MKPGDGLMAAPDPTKGRGKGRGKGKATKVDTSTSEVFKVIDTEGCSSSSMLQSVKK